MLLGDVALRVVLWLEVCHGSPERREGGCLSSFHCPSCCSDTPVVETSRRAHQIAGLRGLFWGASRQAMHSVRIVSQSTEILMIFP